MGNSEEVVDKRDAQRFELQIEGGTAFLEYNRHNGSLVLIHTEVPEHLRGHKVGERLIVAALAAARSEGLQVVAVCPYVRAYLRKHPGALTDT